jgi:8-amino-7-oxononanoate synthase
MSAPTPPAGRVDPLAFLEDEVAALRERHLYRSLRVMTSAQGPIVSIDGQRVISLSSNDYLGLTHHPRLREAALAAVRDFGVGSGAVRTIAGTMTMHEELESELAGFKGTPAVLTFQSGFTANTGVIPTIAGETDLIVSDALNHASIIDGMRLSKAPRQIYPHGDVEALREILREARASGRPGGGPYRMILVVTDGVFSMDGDIAPLAELAELAQRHGCRLMVDEAHATGAIGPGGRGSVAAAGLSGEVDVVMGTLGKALGSYGAYVCASRETTDYLLNAARSFVFSTAPPPAVAAAGLAALELLESQPERVGRLTANAATLRRAFVDEGLEVGGSETQIVPVAVGDAERTMELCERILERGVFAQGIRPPTVPEGSSRLRFTVMSTHRREELERAAKLVGSVARELGLGADRSALAQLAA